MRLYQVCMPSRVACHTSLLTHKLQTHLRCLSAGDTAYFILNEGTGEVSLGFQTLDYEMGPRSFSLTVQARDNPDGMLSERLTVSGASIPCMHSSACCT